MSRAVCTLPMIKNRYSVQRRPHSGVFSFDATLLRPVECLDHFWSRGPGGYQRLPERFAGRVLAGALTGVGKSRATPDQIEVANRLFVGRQ
jgi:hypothetical protein